MERNKVTTAIKEHEGHSYIEVTSTSPAGEVVYSHSAWVDNNPALHDILLQHSWSLNQRTGHLVTQTPQGLFLAMLEAQGAVPDQTPLPRCLAAAVAAGRRILQVQADPTDYRMEALTIKFERPTTALSLPLPEAEVRTISVSEVQSPTGRTSRQELAEQRRAEADQRRELAEQRRAQRAEETFKAKYAREEARKDRVADRAMAEACKAEAEVRLMAALAAKEPWAESSVRRRAGHKPQPGDAVVQSPEWYQRLCRGLPEQLSMEEAQQRYPGKFAAAQRDFENFCARILSPFSQTALRTAWLKMFPHNSWVKWEEPAEAVPTRESVISQRIAAGALHLRVAAADLETESAKRERFDALWESGQLTAGLPPEENRLWDEKFAAAARGEIGERDAVRVAYNDAIRARAWGAFLKDNQ